LIIITSIYERYIHRYSICEPLGDLDKNIKYKQLIQ